VRKIYPFGRCYIELVEGKYFESYSTLSGKPSSNNFSGFDGLGGKVNTVIPAEVGEPVEPRPESRIQFF
jgi:hypothetical protein